MKKLLSLLLLGTMFSFNALSQNPNKIKSNNETGQIYVMSREEAERKIHKFSKKAKEEDSWIHHDGKLIDVGKWGTFFNVQSDSTLIFAQDYQEGDSVWFYHNHPLLDEKRKCHPPGAWNIFTDKEIKKSFEEKNVHIISNVFDGNFKWTYSSSDSLENDFLFHQENPQRAKNMDFIIGYYYRNSSLDKGISKEGLDDFIEKMESVGVYLRYEKPNKP